MVLNVIFIIFNAAMAGGGGIASTQLTSPMTDVQTTMSVTSTTGFLSTDVLAIDNEQIYYTGKTAISFTGLTRGYNDTKAVSHRNSRMIYTQETNMLNQTLGFNVASASSTSGAFAIISMTAGFLGRALINIVVWDFPNIFEGMLIYLRLFFVAIGCGLILYIGINYLLPAMGILKK